MKQKEYREAQRMEATWAEQLREEGRARGLEEGLEKGIEKGRQTGVIVGEREALLKLLTMKFGPLPEPAKSRLHAMESLDELDDYLERVLTATSLEEMGLKG